MEAMAGMRFLASFIRRANAGAKNKETIAEDKINFSFLYPYNREGDYIQGPKDLLAI